MTFAIVAALIFQFGVIAYLAAGIAAAGDSAPAALRRAWALPVIGLILMVLGGGGDARNPLIFEFGVIFLVALLAARDATARGMAGWQRLYLACLLALCVILWLAGRYELTRGLAIGTGLALDTGIWAAIVLLVLPVLAYPKMRRPRLDGTAPTVLTVSGLMGNSAVAPLMWLPRTIIGIIIIVGIAINAGNVVGRYVYLKPIIWAEEIMIYSMVWTVFAGAILVTWDGRHLRMDLLSAALSGMAKVIIGAVAVAAFLATSAVVAWQNYDVFAKMVQLDQRSVVAEIPMAIPHFALLFGFVLMMAAILLRLRRQVYADFESEVAGLVQEYGE